jgi:hypothetical protein
MIHVYGEYCHDTVESHITFTKDELYNKIEWLYFYNHVDDLFYTRTPEQLSTIFKIILTLVSEVKPNFMQFYLIFAYNSQMSFRTYDSLFLWSSLWHSESFGARCPAINVKQYVKPGAKTTVLSDTTDVDSCVTGAKKLLGDYLLLFMPWKWIRNL